MKAKFNGKKYTISTYINGYGEEWFEIEEIKEVKEQPKQPQHKFKAGDKVTLKSRCISKTDLEYLPLFDEYIGERLEVVGYTESGNVQCNNYFYFHEDWLEPWSEEKEELKEGDLAIFWDDNPEYARIAAFSKKEDGLYLDSGIMGWMHAVKFECTKEQREQFDKVIKGEITL